MSTEDMVLQAVPEGRPPWSRGAMSTLVATAQGELALRAAARVLDEHAAARGQQVAEVARVLTGDALHEGVYARLEPLGTAPSPAVPAEDVAALSAQVEGMTRELGEAVTGSKP